MIRLPQSIQLYCSNCIQLLFYFILIIKLLKKIFLIYLLEINFYKKGKYYFTKYMYLIIK